MRLVEDMNAGFLAFDLVCEIGTDPIEFRDHCLDLDRPQTAMMKVKLPIAPQTLVFSHSWVGLLKICPNLRHWLAACSSPSKTHTNLD